MKIVVAFILTTAVALTGCQSSNLQTTAYIKPGFDITSLKRFTWSEPTVSTLGAMFGLERMNLAPQLKKNTMSALREKGYVYVAADDNPQFLVSFVVGAMEQVRESSHTVDRDPINFDSVVSWSQTNEYLQGGVSLVFKDLSVDTIIWQGTATQRIKNQQVARQDGSMIQKLLGIIMQSLPASNF
jgi:hypothetical protein